MKFGILDSMALLTLAFCSACAHSSGRLAPDTSAPPTGEGPAVDLTEVGRSVALEFPIPNTEWIQYRVTPVKDVKEGRLIVESRRQFLIEQIKQSIDPYYGTSRMTPECEAINRVGDLEKNGAHLSFGARVTAPQSFRLVEQPWNPGYCGLFTRAAFLRTKFCVEQLQVVEVMVAGNAKATNPILTCGSPARVQLAADAK